MAHLWPDAKAVGLDGVRIWGPIYQGAAPPRGPSLRSSGFRALVICSVELCDLLSHEDYPGIILHKCPLKDELVPVSGEMWEKIDAASEFIAGCVNGALVPHISVPVLIACQQGKNRSALVTAAAIVKLTGWSGGYAIEHLKRLSPRTFANEHFADGMRVKYPAKGTIVSPA